MQKKIKAPLKTISLNIALDELKGSVNAMMIPSRGGRRLVYSSGYRTAKAKVQKYLEQNYKNLENCMLDKPEFYFTKVEYVAYDNWLTKGSGYRKLRKKDVSNFTKNAEDVVFKFVGLDDSSIVESNVRKGISDLPLNATLHCIIYLYELDGPEDLIHQALHQ